MSSNVSAPGFILQPDLSVQELAACAADTDQFAACLTRHAAALQEFLRDNSGALEARFPGFEHRLIRAILAIGKIEFGSLTDGSAFVLDGTNSITYNVGHALDMYQAIKDAVARDRLGLPEDSEPRLVVMACLLLFFHEARHITQGLEKYETVQELKKQDLGMLVAVLDIQADCDAAQAYAACLCVMSGDMSDSHFLRRFQEALYFNCQCCFPAFKFPHYRADKRARALGLMLMLARSLFHSKSGAEGMRDEIALDLTAPLFPFIDDTYATLALVAVNNGIELVANDNMIAQENLKSLCETIDGGDTKAVVRRAVQVWDGLRIRDRFLI